MGYDFYSTESDVHIDRNDIPKAVELLHAVGFGDDTTDFDNILDNMEWTATYDKDGNVDNIWTDDAVLRDDKEMFEAIAPVVRDGSSIDCVSEDNEYWRWEFHKGTLFEYAGTVVYEDEVERLRELLANAERIIAERDQTKTN